MCGVITIATLSSYLKGETTTSPVPSTIPISPSWRVPSFTISSVSSKCINCISLPLLSAVIKAAVAFWVIISQEPHINWTKKVNRYLVYKWLK
mgnify:CR=1 FL=1